MMVEQPLLGGKKQPHKAGKSNRKGKREMSDRKGRRETSNRKGRRETSNCTGAGGNRTERERAAARVQEGEHMSARKQAHDGGKMRWRAEERLVDGVAVGRVGKEVPGDLAHCLLCLVMLITFLVLDVGVAIFGMKDAVGVRLRPKDAEVVHDLR